MTRDPRPSQRDTADRDKSASTADQRAIEDLILRCARGDRESFSALYDATSGKLFAVCRRVIGDDPDAEDALQDAYVKIWKSAGRYQVTGHSPMTWLITIARNTAIDRLRSKRGQTLVMFDDDVVASSDQTPEQAAIATSQTEQVKRCLDTLPDDRRTAIEGAYLEGRTYADLADAANVPLNTMRTWLRRGLIALRECLAND